MKRYESNRIWGLSVTMNGSSVLFINVYFPVACILRDFNATPDSPGFNEICDMLHEYNEGIL